MQKLKFEKSTYSEIKTCELSNQFSNNTENMLQEI